MKEQVNMNNEFVMSCGQAHEVEQALGRNDWTNAQVKQACAGDFLARIRRVLEGNAEIVERTVQKLLTYVTTIKCSATKKFVAMEHFVEGQTMDGVKIAYLGQNFKEQFLSKTEKDIPAVDIKISRLSQKSKDLGIRAEIGEANEEILLANFWQVMKAHNKVGTWLVGYIIGGDGNLWAVFARLDSDGWFVGADSVEGPSPWGAGGLFCSR